MYSMQDTGHTGQKMQDKGYCAGYRIQDKITRGIQETG